jgi:predicted phosphohydrolase
MRLQFASDLHLNSWATKPIPFEKILVPVATNLVLCGDIGHPDSIMLQLFFKWATKRWDTIFWIPGHHEMTDAWHLQTRTYDECLYHMRAIVSEYPNIHILHREAFMTDDGFLLLGCPLWNRVTALSHENSADPIMKDITKHYVEDLTWLKQQIKKSEIPVIVVSYYPPTQTLMDPNVINKPLSVALAIETELLLKPPVVAWVCGYLHKAIQIEKVWNDSGGNSNKVLIAINPRGYPGENTGYREDAVLRLTKTV